MKVVELKYSKSKIDKAGEILKNGTVKGHERDAALEVLSNWRAYHVAPLNTFSKVLKQRVRKICARENTIVAQRLKRTPSILLKLQTHKTMRERALSYQSIADSFNLWKVATRTGGGQWHPKTVIEIEVKTLSP